MAGTPPLVIIFVVAFAFALVESKARLKTTAYILGSMVLMIGIGFVLGEFFLHGQEAAIGTATGSATLLTGIGASIIQYLKGKKQSPAKSRDLL